MMRVTEKNFDEFKRKMELGVKLSRKTWPKKIPRWGAKYLANVARLNAPHASYKLLNSIKAKPGKNKGEWFVQASRLGAHTNALSAVGGRFPVHIWANNQKNVLSRGKLYSQSRRVTGARKGYMTVALNKTNKRYLRFAQDNVRRWLRIRVGGA